MQRVIHLVFIMAISGVLLTACASSENGADAPLTSQGEPLSPADEVSRIFDVQGHTHVSPHTGKKVTVPGIVTAIQRNGIFLQDPIGDNDPLTSDAIHASVQPLADLMIGDQVLVTGIVRELKSGSNRRQQLGLTDLRSAVVTRNTQFFEDNRIEPVLLGGGGLYIPDAIIDNDSNGSVTTGLNSIFDPEQDGIDFYESLESMKVGISSARVTGPISSFGEYWVTPLPVSEHSGANNRGGLTIRKIVNGIDYNPERIQLDDELITTERLAFNVGSEVSDIEGVLGYSSGNYELILSQQPAVVSKHLPFEETTLVATSSALTIATYNVKNLDPNDDDGDEDVRRGRFRLLALQIVRSLKSPDIIALQEVQDNDGSIESGITSASETLSLLVREIRSQGGPSYRFENINPVNNADGGQPGGNIRVAWLYNPERVSLVSPNRGKKTEAVSLFSTEEGLEMTINPGRVLPLDDAFKYSRKPLAILFDFEGNRIMLVNNHFSSKRGSSPIFGDLQPAINGGESKRLQQAKIVGDFVETVLLLKADAAVVILGDFNEFNFMPALQQLQKSREDNEPRLTNLLRLLPARERYTFVRHGNAQALDHIFVSARLLPSAEVDIVHMNAEYARQISDHDPVVARFLF